VSIDGLVIYVTAGIGFCQFSRAPGHSPEAWADAATTAMREALRNGPAAIRAFSAKMQLDVQQHNTLREGVAQALELGQFQAWYQPQISTDTGEITGFEALARWNHPTRGIINPAEFLPAIEEAGLLERLAEVMMYHSFAALKAWDSAGVNIPQIGVNFAGSELSNPRLIEKIEWELDRFGLTPERLAVEVLETVVASAPDDMITRNINALGKLGCRIDLDDFGTGHASIASIKRFSVSRIKIDRSFVTKADRDQEQQRMISAILTMAERLGIETLAEGVETVGEHVLLAQLGCDHVQGYGIARPMPFEQTLDWVSRHTSKLADVPRMMDGKSR
jgi:EAL domain-containing protein (putative c-di-GMP-specific phosphodiesterase class I)